MYYIPDNRLYNYWKFLKTDKESVDFGFLAGFNQSAGKVAFNFLCLFEPKLKFDKLLFDKKTYISFYNEKYKKAEEYAKGKSNSACTLGKILNGKFSNDDLSHAHFLEKFSICDNVYFKLSEESRDRIKEYVDSYIQEYINDELLVLDKNYTKFDKNKEILIRLLKEYSINRSFGKNFIIQYSPKNFFNHPFPDDIFYNSSMENKDNLLMHTIIAFEYLKYIKVEEAWVRDFSTKPEDYNDDYKIKINLLDKFFNEVIEGNKENNNESCDFEFDLERGLIIFKGKNIKFSKTSKQYDVLKVIFKDQSKDWQFSEILERVDHLNNGNWKKIYDIFNAMGKKIAIDTGVKDFFITTTQSVKVNSKYRKKY